MYTILWDIPNPRGCNLGIKLLQKFVEFWLNSGRTGAKKYYPYVFFAIVFRVSWIGSWVVPDPRQSYERLRSRWWRRLDIASVARYHHLDDFVEVTKTFFQQTVRRHLRSAQLYQPLKIEFVSKAIGINTSLMWDGVSNGIQSGMTSRSNNEITNWRKWFSKL